MAYQGKHYGNVRPDAQGSANRSKKSVRQERREKQKQLKRQQREQKKRQREQKKQQLAQKQRQQQQTSRYQTPRQQQEVLRQQPQPPTPRQQQQVLGQQPQMPRQQQLPRQQQQLYRPSYQQVQQPLPKPARQKAPARAKKDRPKLRIRWGRLWAILLLFAVALTGTGALGYGYYLQRKMVVPGSVLAALPSDKPIDVLLVGLDRDTASYDKQRQQSLNADTILLARLDPSKHSASILAIPPDTRVSLPDGPDQITHAYAEGGIEQLEQSVKDLTGLPINRYMTVDFTGFAAAVDALGGIDFNVPQAMTDPEQIVSLQPGNQHLNGRQALTVLRYVQGDPGGVNRLQRDQQLLGALLDQMKSTSTWSWFQCLRAMSDSVQTNMTLSEMNFLLPSVHASQTSVAMNSVPGSLLNLYGVDYWMADNEKLAQIVTDMQ